MNKNDEIVKERLDNFIKEKSWIWDLTDTLEFIMEYRKELLEILSLK